MNNSPAATSPQPAQTPTPIKVPQVRHHKVVSAGGSIGAKDTASASPDTASANRKPPLVMITAYDYPTAQIADEAGADILLVGDSLAMVVLGLPDTLSVTTEDIQYHTRAVARAQPNALIVADMPWLSYHISPRDTVRNAAELIRAGAGAVKLEGGQNRLPMIEALTDAEIPVMGHIGLTPQSVNMLGGFKVQGRSDEASTALAAEAQALEKGGCFSLVLESIPAKVAAHVTQSVGIATIGIGAGPDCDGQVLVFHDALGLQDSLSPKFVRRYGELKREAVAGLRRFAADVRSGGFPAEDESYMN